MNEIASDQCVVRRDRQFQLGWHLLRPVLNHNLQIERIKGLLYSNFHLKIVFLASEN